MYKSLPNSLATAFGRILCVAVVSLLLSACGGGGGGGNNTVPVDPSDPQSDHGLQDTGRPSGYLYYIGVSSLVRHDLETGLRTAIDLRSAWGSSITSVSVSEDSSYFVALDDSDDEYAVLDSNLSVVHERSANGSFFRVPQISNDKSKVVYGWESPRYDVGDKVKFESLDGAFETQVFNMEGMWHPVWMDDNRILFLRNNGLYSITTNVGAENEMVHYLDFNGTVTDFALSPDHTKVAFLMMQEMASYRTLYVVDLDGSNQLQLTADTSVYLRGLAWSPDGQYIAVGEGKNYSATVGVPSCPYIYLVPVNSEYIADLRLDDPSPAILLTYNDSGVWVPVCFGDDGYSLSWRAQ